jgi:hypothetical protein
MIKRNLLLVLFLITAVLFNACKDNSSDPADDQNGTTGNYFMNANGNYYKYEVSYTDSNGTTSAGTRSATYQGTKTYGAVEYQVQVDTAILSVLPVPITSNSYFSVTNKDGNLSQVNYYVDTSGFSSYVPVEYLPYLHIGGNMTILSLPFVENKSWDVFTINLSYGILKLDVVKVTGTYTGTESINLNLTSGAVTKQAAKVHYVLKVQMPDPANLANIKTSEFDAYAWFVEGIGVVKWQGSNTILNAVTGGGINIYDKSVSTQTLIQYSVK